MLKLRNIKTYCQYYPTVTFEIAGGNAMPIIEGNLVNKILNILPDAKITKYQTINLNRKRTLNIVILPSEAKRTTDSDKHTSCKFDIFAFRIQVCDTIVRLSCWFSTSNTDGLYISCPEDLCGYIKTRLLLAFFLTDFNLNLRTFIDDYKHQHESNRYLEDDLKPLREVLLNSYYVPNLWSSSLKGKSQSKAIVTILGDIADLLAYTEPLPPEGWLMYYRNYAERSYSVLEKVIEYIKEKV